MTAAARRVLNQALNLSDEKRQEVLSELSKHVPEESLSQEEWDKAEGAEIEKRIADIESGK